MKKLEISYNLLTFKPNPDKPAEQLLANCEGKKAIRVVAENTDAQILMAKEEGVAKACIVINSVSSSDAD